MPSFYKVLERSARRHSALPALVTQEGRSWTYGELLGRASNASARMASLGLLKGDRAAFLLPNSPEYAASLLGCFRSGIVAALFDPRCAPRELWEQARLVRPKLLVVPAGLEKVLFPVARLAGIQRTVSVDELCSKTSLKSPAAVLSSNAPAEIIFTSGTTGGTKGVVLSHGALAANSLASAAYISGGRKADPSRPACRATVLPRIRKHRRPLRAPLPGRQNRGPPTLLPNCGA